MSFKPISDTLQELIVEMFDSGQSIYYIADTVNLDRNTVYKYLLREGRVEPDPEVIENSRKRYTEEERARVVRLYNEGVPVRDISEQTGMSIPSIYNHVRKNKVNLRTTPQKDLDKAVKWYVEKRYLVQDILDKTGVPRASFYRELKKRRANGEDI